MRVDSGPATLLRLDSAVTLDSIPAGSADISIDLLRSQCSVPQNPVTVTITEADTAQLHFDISCQVNWGFLMVALPTTGANQPGLLIISVDGETKGGASPNTVGLGFPYILAGPHSISLSGAGPNCAIAEANPQDVVIPLDDTVHVTFTLTCP